MNKRVTMKDIARALNVSIGTVERALHGKKDISPETRERVMDKVKELNYQPNKHARSLSVKQKKEIAVIMPYNSGFCYRVKEGIEYAEKELSFYGVGVKFICLKKMDANIVLSYLKDLKTDAVILMPLGLDKISEELDEIVCGGKVLAMLNDEVSDFKGLFYVGPDNELIGRLAGELIGKFSSGKGKCLTVYGINSDCGNMTVECRLRMDGFTSTIRRDYPGIRIDTATYPVYGEDTYNAVLDKLGSDMDITSIYSVDGYLNEAAVALKDSGRKGVILVGHEMSEEVNSHLKSGIVTAAICQNPFLQGYYALKYMIEYLVDHKLPRYERMYINFNIYMKHNTFGLDNYSHYLGLNL